MALPHNERPVEPPFEYECAKLGEEISSGHSESIAVSPLTLTLLDYVESLKMWKENFDLKIPEAGGGD